MSWPDLPPRSARRRFLRLAGVFALAGLTAGCFQPLYGDGSIGGNSAVRGKLASVDVPEISTPNGTALARISVHLRNQLIYALTGGGQATNPAYRLDIRLVATQQQIIVDINSGRPEVLNYGINASYTMTELATGRVVVNSTTTSRVSYNVPGQEQRFAGARGLRDAENRAADVIARNINDRLASYFVAGT
jgi:LPS-assembly lipoprotein